MIQFLRMLKLTATVYIAGTATGAYGWDRLVHQPFVHVVADRGRCAQRDIMSTVYVFACTPESMRETDIAADQEAQRILADMARKQPTRSQPRSR